MKKLAAFTLAALFALALTPAIAKTTSSQMMMPNCKGRMVMADMTKHLYSTNTHWKVRHHKMMMMCEAAAKAKGYHMISHSTVKSNAPTGCNMNASEMKNMSTGSAQPVPTPTP